MPSINDRADPVLAPVALHAAQKTENTIRYVLIQFLRLLPMFMSGSMGVKIVARCDRNCLSWRDGNLFTGRVPYAGLLPWSAMLTGISILPRKS
jgi:hypothetical protein